MIADYACEGLDDGLWLCQPQPRARLVARAEDWSWSSVDTHLAGKDDPVTTVAPALSRIGDFRAFLDGTHEAQAFEALRGAEGTGRPVGNGSFLVGLEDRLGRNVRLAKRGPKVKVAT